LASNRQRINLPSIGCHIPRRKRSILSGLGRLCLAAAGWRFADDLPNIPKGVVIFAPHTSNWDFVIGIFAIFSMNVQATWIGKHTLFRKPIGKAARWLGGIPIDRRSSQAMVARMVSRFREMDRFLLVMAPEGTRRKTSRWKSGFYHIAEGAGVPILIACLDYPSRSISFSRLVTPSGDYPADLEKIQSLTERFRGKKPRQAAIPSTR